MAKYATLKAAIEEIITTNGIYEISGEDMRETLKAIVDSLGADYQLVGFALPATDPGTPDQNVAYLAGPGTYPNFGPTTVEKGQIGLFKYNGTWSYETIDCGVSIEYEEYPGGDAFEWTFYDSDNPDGLTIKIAKTVSGLGNDPNVAISQWWAAQTERKINVLGGYTISIDSLTTTPQSLGLFEAIQSGQIIDNITGVNKLIFGTDGGGSVTVNASDLPYKATANLFNVRTDSGTAHNVSIVVRGINDILPAYININEIANHPAAYANAATALGDVPTLYRRTGVKVVYLDDTQQLWIEMLCVDDAGANWWTDVTNNWVIEGPIETKVTTPTGGQQLRIAGEKRGNLDDVLNVNVWNEQITAYDSAASARAAVPANKRKLGGIIVYLLSDGWHIDQYNGSSISDWTTTANWISLILDFNISTQFQILGLLKTKYSIQEDTWYGEYYNHIVIPVNGGETVDYTQTLGTFYCAFLTSYETPVVNATPNFVSGYSGRQSYTTGTFQIPAGTKFLIINNIDLTGLSSLKINGFDIFGGIYTLVLNVINAFNLLPDRFLENSDLGFSSATENIGDKDNIFNGLIDNLGNKIGGINPPVSGDWNMLRLNVQPGQIISFGNFSLGRAGYAAFFNGETLISFFQFAYSNGNFNGNNLGVVVPSGATTMWIDVSSNLSPENPYSQLMVNYGSILLPYVPFAKRISTINGIRLIGDNGGGDLATIIADLPVSDGSDVSSGYAYIDSSTRNVKVKA